MFVYTNIMFCLKKVAGRQLFPSGSSSMRSLHQAAHMCPNVVRLGFAATVVCGATIKKTLRKRLLKGRCHCRRSVQLNASEGKLKGKVKWSHLTAPQPVPDKAAHWNPSHRAAPQPLPRGLCLSKCLIMLLFASSFSWYPFFYVLYVFTCTLRVYIQSQKFASQLSVCSHNRRKLWFIKWFKYMLNFRHM